MVLLNGSHRVVRTHALMRTRTSAVFHRGVYVGIVRSRDGTENEFELQRAISKEEAHLHNIYIYV